MVAEHSYLVSGSAYLVGDGCVILTVAGEASPVNHSSGRTFEQRHHFALGAVAELVFLEVRHNLVCHKMDGPGVFGHFGGECSRGSGR